MKQEKIAIIFPTRIGDSILSLPVIVCLQQLNEKYNSNLDVNVLIYPYLLKLFASLKCLNVRSMNLAEKLKSRAIPADRAFFIETTYKNFGYHSKKSYGIENSFKKFLKFSVQPRYLQYSSNQLFLTYENLKTFLPGNLLEFLTDKYGFSLSSISLFGICLELGYSEKQIIDTFNFSSDLFSLDEFNDESLAIPEKPYLIFCIEAGYSKKHMDERCWEIEKYFEMAEKCYRDFGYKIVFIGMNRGISLPDKNYIEDYRGKLNLFQLACLLKKSAGYVGNDTGPLHIANLMKKRSVAAYFAENNKLGFGPIFAGLNTQVFQPESVDDFYSYIVKTMQI